jgi:LysR family hydrogen peroxide-inducible transcriptional activator
MELRQLEYLLAVCDAGSFTGAAARLGVRQPSVSEQVKNLERELGRPLLDRLPGRVVPTAAGRQLVERARRILGELGGVQHQVTDAADLVAGPLTVGAIPTIAPFLFPQLMGAFEAKYPEVSLRLVEETTPVLVSRVLTGEIDLAIASSVDETSHLHAEEIATEELILLVPESHRIAKRKRVSMEMLEGERFVVLQELNCLAGQAARFCAKRGVGGESGVTASNVFTLAAMVAAGAGVAIVPAMMASHAPVGLRGCAFRRFAGEGPTRPVCLLWSLLRYRPQSARRFGEMATATLAGWSKSR